MIATLAVTDIAGMNSDANYTLFAGDNNLAGVIILGEMPRLPGMTARRIKTCDAERARGAMKRRFVCNQISCMRAQ
jgi:hypothetical protein